MGPRLFGIGLWVVLGTTTAVAQPGATPARTAGQAGDEPATCRPPCRFGYTCHQGRCVSLCNPPCPAGEICVEGECAPRAGWKKKQDARRYFGVSGGGRIGLNAAASNVGEVRAEFGSRYGALQVGPSFGDGSIAVRAAILGQVPLQPTRAIPLLISPTLALGYTFSWLDDGKDTRRQEIFITPGVRLRYDLLSQLALVLDLIAVEINFLRLEGDADTATRRVGGAAVHWTLAGGLHFLY